MSAAAGAPGQAADGIARQAWRGAPAGPGGGC
jgi:hypothetical protein